MEQSEPPFWLVWRNDGYTPRFRHPSRFAAEREATRLAEANPGTEFYVLMPVTQIVAAGLTFKTYDPPSGIPF